MSNWFDNWSQTQWDELDDTVRCVFIHPNYPHPHLFFRRLLDYPDTLYYRLDGNNLTCNEIQQQVSNGKPLDAPHIILDEGERASSDELIQFLRTQLNEQSKPRWVIVSRDITLFEMDDDLRANSCFIPHHDDMMMVNYVRQDRERPLLEVYAFGKGRIYADGKAIDDWDGLLPRALFFYIIDKGMVTRDDIFKTFWPQLTKKEATNVFHVTKRKINEILGLNVTKYGGGFYRVSPDIDLHYDVIKFAEQVHQSAIQPDGDSLESLQRAMTLYRAPFLSEMEGEWIDNRRAELSELLGEAYASLGDLSLKQEQIQVALGYYLNALARDAERQDWTEMVMQLYLGLGMPQDAVAVYQRLEDALYEAYETAPNVRLRQLVQDARLKVS